jgi:ABC-type transport system substrate-binding protein
MVMKNRYLVGFLAVSVAISGCSTKSADSAASSIPASTEQPSSASSSSTPQSAPSTGEPGSGSNDESVGRLDCQTLNALGVNSQSVSTIVDSTMQVNPGMSKESATADLVKLVHLYCPNLADELQQATSN